MSKYFAGMIVAQIREQERHVSRNSQFPFWDFFCCRRRMWSDVSTPPTPSGWERGMSKNTPKELAGAPGSKGKGGPSPIKEIKSFLRKIKIEASGPAEIYQQLGDALYEAVDEVAKRVADSLYLKLTECDEEPDSITYASGIGFKWTKTVYCSGKIEKYHILVEVIEGYNNGKGKAELRSIELVKGDVNERGG